MKWTLEYPIHYLYTYDCRRLQNIKLTSDEQHYYTKWLSIRHEQFNKLPYCMYCGDKPGELHYIKYDDWRSENIHLLKPICNQCHKQIHTNVR